MAKALDEYGYSEYIDSRELIERLQELENLADDTEQTYADGGVEDDLTDDEADELRKLREICGEGESTFADWPYGTSLIPEHEWTNYAQEFAQDIGALDSEAGWPNSCIDWEQAANELQMDYTSIEIDGTIYYGR